MQYTLTIEIDLPRTRVIRMITDLDNAKAWQPNLSSVELLEGTCGQVGARTRLVYRAGNHSTEFIHTVVQRREPEYFEATFEAKGIVSLQASRLTELDGHRTQWELQAGFRLSGFMWFMSKLIPGMFKKQTAAIMRSFKNYAESTGE